MESNLLEHINLVFIGHVNAGKSTTCGQILCLTGMIDDRTMEKYNKEAIENGQTGCGTAYVTDTDEEEKERNITIDVGKAYFTTSKKRYTILDAPGHRMFIPNMINGVCQADVAILLIPARKGEFEAGFEKGGQTKEASSLSKMLGIKKIIVAINKMDDPTVNWNQDRFENIKHDVCKYLREIGYKSNDIFVVPISGFTGLNIKTKISTDICSWNTSPSLLDILDSLQTFERLDEKSLRIPILDRIKEDGKTIILGKIETGVLKIGDEIICNPNNIKMNVLKIYNNDIHLDIANPGENVKIYVKLNSSSEEDYIVKGNMLCHNSCTITKDIVAKIYIRELTDNIKIVSESLDVMIHIGLITEDVKIVKILEKIDNKGNTIEKLPKFVLGNSFIIAHLSFNKPLCIEKYEDFDKLGLFVLRNEGKTLGFGKVIATNAPRLVKKNI